VRRDHCSICSRELAAERAASTPARPARTRSGSSTRSATRRAPGVVTRRVARAADDGYRNALVPGLRATADAERLAAAVAWADARLEPPGPHPAVAEQPEREEAFWLAFLLTAVTRWPSRSNERLSMSRSGPPSSTSRMSSAVTVCTPSQGTGGRGRD
jgi:hypothetical protein